MQVKHLQVLTGEVAPRFPSNQSLLHDLIMAYNWLRDHIEEARGHLRQHRTSLLWLNVNDPRDGSTPWTWRSGPQLIFDLRFDNEEGEQYDVKEFLVPYKEILFAAGAHEQARLTVPIVEQEIPHDKRLRRGLEDLRSNDMMTDIQFEVGGEIIKAHRVVLAGAIAHFRDVLTGPFQEGEVAISAEIPMIFPTTGITSAFAMRSVIGKILQSTEGG